MNQNQAVLAAAPLLASIAEALVSVEQMKVKKDAFVGIGCYLYRGSLAIMELQALEHDPAGTVEVFQSLSNGVNLAKEVITKCQKLERSVTESELDSSVRLLELVVSQMGGKLASVPSAAYGDEKYAEIAVQSISKEMKSVQSGLFLDTNLVTGEEFETGGYLKEKDLDEAPAVKGADLYSVDFEDLSEACSPSSSSVRNFDDLSIGSSASSLRLGQYVEPLYDAFFCPLTKNVMEEPVTIESGVTYERRAIESWFKRFEGLRAICCPATGQILKNKSLSVNVALKTTIEEWKKRDDAARIRLSRAALSLASSESMVLEALQNLQTICHNKAPNKQKIRENGMIPLLIKFLQYKNSRVRCATLQILQELAEEDQESKALIGAPGNISKIVKLILSNHQPIRHGALLLLFELSFSRSLCDGIGSVTGGILMLITARCNQANDAFASHTANQILRNLGRSSHNVKLMAENGYLDPLLDHLTEGDDESKMEMASYLGEIILSHENKCYVAQRASPALIKMIRHGGSLNRTAAFKALQQISTYQISSRVLVETGVVQTMAEEILNRNIHNEPVDLRREATGILAAILESGVELENLQVNDQGHTMASDYVVFSIICLIKNSTPDEVNLNLIRILLCLANSSKIMNTIVSAIDETETCYILIGFINYPNEQTAIAAIKLLIKLAPRLGHTLVDKLLKTKGQPEGLIKIPEDQAVITELHSVAANLLAKLPPQNLTLNLALLSFDAAGKVLQLIAQVRSRGMRRSRHAESYLEGLVGILVRFTATLYDPQMLFLARNHNLASAFTELLLDKSSDEVQRLSLIGLENLSSESCILSKPPQAMSPRMKKTSYLLNILKCRLRSPSKKPVPFCPVHKGICSAQETFCLVEAKAVEKMLACLDHGNAEVVEAALSAIQTLLSDKVDSDKSITLLSSFDATHHLLKAVKEHKQDSLWQKAFWVLEKFLSNGKDESVSDISQDRWLHATLVNAYHSGNGNARQIAERLLQHMNKIPEIVSGTYTF
uniref:RING-type E3 ubiquitin transferase n=1 Tax=Kalanchoe fedtschenkoi TaxID=63787 RepID=A0A7N0UDT8_KALFE